VARRNARRLGLTGRLTFHEGDLLDPVADLAGRFDLVASNPPYVDPAQVAKLMPEVRDHEPRLAIQPPGDQCSLYRRLAPQALRALRPGARLLLEVGQGMDAEVALILEGAGLAVERIVPDLSSIPRTVVARKPQ
jgi:release factor glutamine methyltransferase